MGIVQTGTVAELWPETQLALSLDHANDLGGAEG